MSRIKRFEQKGRVLEVEKMGPGIRVTIKAGGSARTIYLEREDREELIRWLARDEGD